MPQKFHQRFNIEVSLMAARRSFVNRINNFIFANLLKDMYKNRGLNPASRLEEYLCSKLGERWNGWGCLQQVLLDDYHLHLRAIEVLFKNPETKDLTNTTIKKILLDSEIDIGIRWDNGYFLPSGAPLLDEKLVNDALGLLTSKGYDGVLTPFRKGLDHFLHSVKNPDRLADVTTDMYEALEALAKIITGKDKDLSANTELLISKLGVSEEYKPILKAYIAYANEFRHAAEKGQKKDIPPRQEVESFIYLTGLFLRLAMII